jgi:predicted regulator of Ras-like GTPase activity (Roadblock/LC7/MglB family)
MEQVKAVADAHGSWMTSGSPPPPRPSSTWTAPVSGVSSEAPAPAQRVVAPPPPAPADTTEPTTILDELVAQVAGVRSALLASVDGFGIARSSSMTDEAAHPAMLAAAVGLAHQLVSMGGGEHLRQLVVDHDGGLMLVWPIGDQRVLAVLADTTVEQRRVRAFVQTRASWLAGASS